MTLAHFQPVKTSAVCNLMTGHFRGLAGFKAKNLSFEVKTKDLKMCSRGLHLVGFKLFSLFADRNRMQRPSSSRIQPMLFQIIKIKNDLNTKFSK